jgi:hypothetical protein
MSVAISATVDLPHHNLVAWQRADDLRMAAAPLGEVGYYLHAR